LLNAWETSDLHAWNYPSWALSAIWAGYLAFRSSCPSSSGWARRHGVPRRGQPRRALHPGRARPGRWAELVAAPRARSLWLRISPRDRPRPTLRRGRRAAGAGMGRAPAPARGPDAWLRSRGRRGNGGADPVPCPARGRAAHLGPAPRPRLAPRGGILRRVPLLGLRRGGAGPGAAGHGALPARAPPAHGGWLALSLGLGWVAWRLVEVPAARLLGR
jgi:hypothetical protein